MQHTTLGRTGLEVSRIAYGTWQFGGDWGSFDEDAALAAIRGAWDSGITFFDTAQGYGMGRAEEVLGRGLREPLRHERDRVMLATKGGIAPGTERSRRGDRAFLREGVEASLRNLGVDHVDLYQVHWPDPDTPLAETAGALAELVGEGKIAHVGVSNFSVPQMREFAETLPVETLQPPYHLFRRGIESEVLPYAREHDIGVLSYSALGSGLLTGTLSPDSTFAEDDWRAHASAFRGETLARNLEVVARLEQLAAEKGVSVGRLAIAWVLAQPGIHTAIIGASTPEHVASSAAAADLELSGDDLDRIESAVADGVSVEGATPEGVD